MSPSPKRGQRSARPTRPKTEVQRRQEIEPIYKAVGQRIGDLRREQGFTQEVLSEQVGMSQNFLARIERGMRRVTLAQLSALAEALGVPLALLVGKDVATESRPVPAMVIDALGRLERADQELLGRVARKMAHSE